MTNVKRLGAEDRRLKGFLEELKAESVSFESERVSPEEVVRLLESWETVTISNDFVFCKVMQDEGLLAELIRMILPKLEFEKVRIQPQKAVNVGMDIHGVRFDVFVSLKTGESVTVEMQVAKKSGLPKRMRYYGSMSDMDLLERGIVYSELKDSYVIMICLFDLYGEGRHQYTFTNRCHESPGLEMGDGTMKVVLNAVGKMDDVPPKLRNFLDYVAGKEVEDAYVMKVQRAVVKARANKRWRREYMLANMRDLEKRMEGREEGREEGRKEGRKEGREEERKEVIAGMLKKGRSPEEIADFCGYPVSLVNDILMESKKSVE